MTKKRKLMDSSNFNVSIYEVIELVLHSKKSKYVEMAINLAKNKLLKNIGNGLEIKNYLIKEFDLDVETLNSIPTIKLIMLYKYLDGLIDTQEIKTLNSFIELNEIGLIKNNDVTSYKSFDDVFYEISAAQIRKLEKDSSKDNIRIYENDEWLLIKPLSWSSSVKYGSSTKWCTSSKTNPSHFLTYSKEGMIIYCLNKSTGNHIAVYKRIKYEDDLSFWNILDKRIDSMETNIPSHVLEVLRTEISKNITNDQLLTDEQRQREQEVLLKWEMENQLSEERELPYPEPINVVRHVDFTELPEL